MKTAYFDCIFGVSGDMILGALVACGVPVEHLREQLGTLDVAGFGLEEERLVSSGIDSVKVHVHTEHQHVHRHLADIVRIIDGGGITPRAKDMAKRIFTRLAEAEARVHGTTPDKIHFHEVGALDAIVDVVGACIGLEYLGVERIMASELRVGTGTVKCAHGVMPVPVPAVVELTTGVPVVRTSYDGEIMTPTGAAIVTTLSESYGPADGFRGETVGYGVGTKTWDDHPNLLRIMIGETPRSSETDTVFIIDTNIDDMNPEVFGYVSERLFEAGALDVFMTPIYMKKGRPGTLLSVISPSGRETVLAEIVLAETTTIGLRMTHAVRKKLSRDTKTVETPFGTVRVKTVAVDGHERYAPEYEDCARIAREKNVPLIEVYAAVRAAGAVGK